MLPLLGPEQLGVWKSVMLLKPAVGLVRLAISTGMTLRVPYQLGADRREHASRLMAAAGVI
jgi:hypothetical protein